jgi:hypothetical protein
MRRPLLLLFLLGCVVSLQASNRLSARLIADGILSFAFIPVFELLSLAIVYRRAARRVPFAKAVDMFFAGNAPWVYWLLVFVAIRAVQTPEQATAWPVWWQWTVMLSLLAPIAWTSYVDLQFFRSVTADPGRRAALDLTLQRLISWTCIVGYFIGHDGTTFFQVFTGWMKA